jgi:hypothetical protein
MVVHIVDGICTALSLLSELCLYDGLFYTFGKRESKEASGPGDEGGMKRISIAILLAVVIPACHRGPASEVIVPPPETIPPLPEPSEFTQVVFQATNYDSFDYALWIEWFGPDNQWHQTYLFSVWGDPVDGPTMNFEVVTADPSVVYYVLLADPWGNLYDSYQLDLPTATSVDVSFNIVDGFLVRTL